MSVRSVASSTACFTKPTAKEQAGTFSLSAHLFTDEKLLNFSIFCPFYKRRKGTTPKALNTKANSQTRSHLGK